MQRDYYEVLQVQNTATLSEIRASFRRLALKWHPDKNPDRVEEATQRFKELQHAYAVLSDENERAWYDAHKESILAGKEPQSEDTSKEAGIRKATNAPLFECFSTGFYNGYADDANSFYTRFREVFETLDREERSFAEDVVLAPSFGRSDSSWEDVSKFYSYWENFQTKKPFAFVDKWNLNDAPNREIRRAMEKENKRERQNARKEFTAAVRSLVRYVKRRDKRVARRRQEELEEENWRQEKLAEEMNRRNEEAEQLRKKLQEERQKLIEEELVHLDELLEELDLESSLNGSVVAEDIKFTCTICKKTFRSLSQWGNHESSKKHADKMRKARKDMFLKNEELNPLEIRVGKEKITLEQYLELYTSPEGDSETKEEYMEEEDYIEGIDNDEYEEKHEGEEFETENGNSQATVISSNEDGIKSFTNSTVENSPNGDVEKDTAFETESKKKGRKKRRNKSNKKNEISNRCNVCGENFTSRNKLFEHIRTEGHALRVS
ncbi:hypothetical protein GAYE_SCF00G1823 [Galdieria yellowstonensis]|uniref:Uncharacterized protein n=1 Tax=Galdieria yellowstonensis TaxID=3028027 RepID=A0AAV9I954_9RHOD|nr:hypothetical protein GAYE_SCF00G1823 [Galdieria yellowstonensis]